MNWLDFILIVILVIGLVVGQKIGILGAIYCTVVVLLAWLAAAQLGSLVDAFVELFLDDDQTVITVSFPIIMALVIYLAMMLWPSVRDALGAGTLGASSVLDRVGGLVAGLAFGIAVSGVLLVGLMQLTYSFEALDEDLRDGLETALIDSTFVPMFVEGAYALPGDSLGLIPGDFQTSLETLKARID